MYRATVIAMALLVSVPAAAEIVRIATYNVALDRAEPG